MTKTKASLAGAVLLAAGASLLLQHHAQARLAAENASLRQRLADLPAVRPPANGPGTDAAELGHLRQAEKEVLRLRGEIGLLRQESQTANRPQGQRTGMPQEESDATNTVSGFSRLTASASAQVPNRQTLFTGGWTDRPGRRLFVLVTPTITGENSDQVAVKAWFLGVADEILADFGLEAFKDGVNESTLCKVMTDEMEEALAAKQASISGTSTIGIGEGTSTNGEPVSLYKVMAIDSEGWRVVNIEKQINAGQMAPGQILKLAGDASNHTPTFDLGPCTSPPLVIVPVISSDRKSIGLTVEATIFDRLEDKH